jgi:hypothetical protein
MPPTARLDGGIMCRRPTESHWLVLLAPTSAGRFSIPVNYLPEAIFKHERLA